MTSNNQGELNVDGRLLVERSFEKECVILKAEFTYFKIVCFCLENMNNILNPQVPLKDCESANQSVTISFFRR